MDERKLELKNMQFKLDTALMELAGVKERLAALELIKQTILTDISRKEARGLTEGITDRHEREESYDWLLEQNTKRLFDGKQPCRDLGCSK
jgi:hypothetical protein